jgi:hypothetical protein
LDSQSENDGPSEPDNCTGTKRQVYRALIGIAHFGIRVGVIAGISSILGLPATGVTGIIQAAIENADTA